MFTILIIVSAIGVYYVIDTILAQRRCPTDQDMYLYAKSKIPKDSNEGRTITAHLGICEVCKTKFLELNGLKNDRQ